MADGSLDFPLPSEAAPAAALPPSSRLDARCARKIGRHIQRVMGSDDEIDDLVQEVLVAIFTKADTLRNPALFDAWVAQVTRNKMRHAIRQRTLRRRALATWHAHHDLTFHPDLDGQVIGSRVMDVLDRLSPKERSLLVALWFTPGNVNDIAGRWGCSASTLRRRLDRAQRRFATLARRDAALAALYEKQRRGRQTAPKERPADHSEAPA